MTPCVRERVSVDISHGQLVHSAIRETPTDRIAALALSCRLGAALWRLRAVPDRATMREAVQVLAGMIRVNKVHRESIVNVAAVALDEWLNEKCPKCNGRGHVVSGSGVAHNCGACAGTGIRRHSDLSRQRRLGVSRHDYQRRGGYEQAMAVAHSLIAEADAATELSVRKLLGRSR